MIYLKAHAKINLDLFLKQKKCFKKYHQIKSRMIIVDDLFDDIFIESSIDDCDVINSNFKLIHENVIFKTLKILRCNKIINQYYNITLEKRIPIYSGLGGFSSIAAVITNYFIKGFPLKIKNKIMKKVASKIGSDCWFFFSEFKYGQVSKYGNKVKELTTNARVSINNLLFIDVKCKTKDVFVTFKKYKMYKNNKHLNMLTPAIIKKYPELEKIYNKEKFFFTGSGSTLVDNTLRNKITI